jgi:hypothetical protein
MSQLLQPIGVAVVALGLLLGTARPAQAALILTMEEVGGDVIVEGSGTANLDGLSFFLSGGGNGFIAPVIAFAIVGGSGLIDVYSGLSGPGSFGPGAAAAQSSGTGDVFGVEGQQLLVLPSGYVSGAPLSGTSVYAGATFASLGVTPGTYVWTWGSTNTTPDSLTLQIGPAAVPEPVSLSLLAVGVAGLVVRRWRRRTA